MSMRGRRLVVAAVAGAALVGAVDCGAADSGGLGRAVDSAAVPDARADEAVRSCGPQAGYVNRVFSPYQVSGIFAADRCAGGGDGLALVAPGNRVERGQSAHWQAITPPGLQIDAFSASGVVAAGVNVGSFGSFGTGGFYWQGGGQKVYPHDYRASYGSNGIASSYLGFSLTCEARPNCGTRHGGGGYIYVPDISLQVRETVAPRLTNGAGLWQSQGWVRGDWPLSFNGDSPSGVCILQATVNGQPTGSVGFRADPTVWHQCAATGLATVVHTTQYGNGQNALALDGADAAQLPASVGKAVYVDNQAPTVSVSGPGDAPSTAGTQFVTATAAAGPSGVLGISCTVDGQPVSYPGASARVPVSGVGVHVVACQAANNSRDSSGAVARSAPASTTLSIRRPTAFGIGFSRVKDALRCRRASERVHVPGRVVTVRRHHRLVRVHRRGHFKVVSVRRCHARIVTEKVPYFVTVTRHGKRVRVRRYRRVRVVVQPHQVETSTRRVAYGHSTTVGGVLLDNDRVPLPGQAIQIVSAPDNGQGQFSRVAVATTGANGGWSARLPAGPSRLVQALYGGASLDEPSASAQVRVVVRASVSFRIAPRRTHWGSTITISGRLHGGYIPPAGELVALRVGYRGGSAEVGHLYARSDGSFLTRYTFLHGNGSATYQFWATTAAESDYPYAPGRSRKVSVSVGP